MQAATQMQLTSSAAALEALTASAISWRTAATALVWLALSFSTFSLLLIRSYRVAKVLGFKWIVGAASCVGWTEEDMPGRGTQESQGACIVYTPSTPTVSEERLRKGVYLQCSDLGSVKRLVGSFQFLQLASLLPAGLSHVSSSML